MKAQVSYWSLELFLMLFLVFILSAACSITPNLSEGLSYPIVICLSIILLVVEEETRPEPYHGT